MLKGKEKMSKTQTAIITNLAVMSSNAQPPSSCVVFVDDFNVRHESLNADEVRRILSA